MVDPTSDLGEDVTEDTAPRCAVCSEPIVNEPTHQVLTRVKEGSVSTVHFCTSACRSEWSE
ncbi:homolog to small CPxCG-related zinc finger protein [Natronomonas moolapensis 8.8.11]|uniref:Homolog to small CPxCG-related zinc finger protein n=1 Tax=Natronomonas moolapensis (strain DSM 18674 / CECT 7526 / JCM 14361 / 8.8.11) TaxID=268739 RepID=M1XQ26_NATM8|nr:hypothetical protein [Natronomonas moolapensis]CCQ36160.1 homolog to small CPxCG-related zinc finger protein [Natronomonas moolapensis 8.8.11]